MKRSTALAILAAAVIGTSYVGNVGAATRTVQNVSTYTCTNDTESVRLISGRNSYGDIWIQLQSNKWAVRYNKMHVISLGGEPGLTSDQNGVRLTIAIQLQGKFLDVVYGNKQMYTCAFVEDQQLVNWER